MLKMVANKITGDKILVLGASVIGLMILKNDINENNKLNLYKKSNIIVKSGIFDKNIKSINYSSFRFPFQRTMVFKTEPTQMTYDINFGECKKRISYAIKMSDVDDCEKLLKRLHIYSFNDMHNLDKLNMIIREIVQKEINKLGSYDLYENHKNTLIYNINTELSDYGNFITDLVIGI
jgi:hypothetical protein